MEIIEKLKQMDEEVIDWNVPKEKLKLQLTDSKEECDKANHKSKANNIFCRIFGHNWNMGYKETVFCERCKRLWRYW